MLRIVPFLVAAVVIGSTPGRSQASAQDLPAHAAMLAAVDAYGDLTIFDEVTLSVHGGVTLLRGKVTQPYKRDEVAARAAHVARMYGVREPLNRIDVLPRSPADDELRKQIARAIYGNAAFWNLAVMPHPPIRIIVEDGRVTLTGTVSRDVDRALARTLAQQAGARVVTNQLKIAVPVQAARDTSN
jgi:osmotically-inducible protein OsmY